MVVRSNPHSAWREWLPGVELRELRPILAGARQKTIDTRAALEAAGLPVFAAAAAAADVPLTIVVNDSHRYTDTRLFLDAVFAVLDGLELAHRPAVRMLVAAGTHRADALERSAHEERIAAPYLRRFQSRTWHDADDGDTHAELAGYVFHRWMTEHGYYLACGSCEPHYFAGVTGAYKTLTVGVMSRTSIERSHCLAMQPAAMPLSLDGNPVHEEIVASLTALERSGAKLLALDQIVAAGRVIDHSAGHPLANLRTLIPTARDCFAARLDGPVDLVVACVQAPLDRDLYQADKGIKNTEHAVRDGGVMILDAACAHGVGIDHFIDTLRAAPTHAAALALVADRGYRLGDHKAVRLRALTDTRKVRAALVSTNVEPALAPVLGLEIFATCQQAARWALGQLAAVDSPRGVIVADAGTMALEVG